MTTKEPASGWDQTVLWFNNNGTAILWGLGSLAIVGGIYWFITRPKGPAPPPDLNPTKFAKMASLSVTAVVILLVSLAGYFIYVFAVGDSHSSGNVAPTPVDSKSPVTVSAAAAPANNDRYGLLYWMYIEDWNYKFGQTKSVLKRSGGGHDNPKITLHPTENTLQVKVSVFPTSGTTTGTTTPAPAGSSGSATDSSFTLNVQDVPLQTWFAVGVSLSGRSLDVYIDGKLVRSAFLPGVPRPVSSDLRIMPDGGFSGKIIDLYNYSRSLTPNDALQHYNAGTSGNQYTGDKLPSGKYKVKLGLFNASGEEVKKFVF